MNKEEAERWREPDRVPPQEPQDGIFRWKGGKLERIDPEQDGFTEVEFELDIAA